MAILSIILTLLGSEYVLRHHFSPLSVFGPWFVPSQSAKGFEWQFLNFNSPQNNLLKNFHPIYGWDNGPSGIRETSSPSGASLATTKIVFVGDSFIYGSEVGPEHTMASRIQDLFQNAIAINMGVPGFGIDQSYLKMVNHGLSEKPDIVVFGIHPPNYERATLDFYNRPKPKFNLNRNGELALIPAQIYSSPPALYDTIESDRRFDLFTIGALIKILHLTKARLSDAPIQKYFDTYDPVIAGILSNAKNKANEAGALFLIVQIPHGNRLRSEEDYQRYRRRYPLNAKLIGLYDDLGIHYVDLEAEFLTRFDYKEIFKTLYTEPGSANSAGHLSIKGNLIAAELIAKKISDLTSAPH